MKRIMTKQEVIDAIMNDTEQHVAELNIDDLTLDADIIESQGVLSITLAQEIESNGGSLSTGKKNQDDNDSYGYCDKVLRVHYNK